MSANNAFAQNKPYLIDCKIDKDEFVLPMLPPGGSIEDIIVSIDKELNDVVPSTKGVL